MTIVVVRQLVPGVFRVSLHDHSYYSRTPYGAKMFFRPSIIQHVRIGWALKASRRRQRRNKRQELLHDHEARLQRLL